MQAVELARQKSRQRCRNLGLVLLDDSVALEKLRLARNNHGRIEIWREYQFEFTSDGDQRYNGEITLLGKSLINIVMEAYRIPAQAVDE